MGEDDYPPTATKLSDQIHSWLHPWRQIPQHPAAFFAWFLIAVVIGSVGTWLLPLISADIHSSFLQAVTAGTLGSFGIVLLSDSVAITLVGPPSDQPMEAEAGRRLGGLLALFLVIVQVALLVIFSFAADLPHEARLVGIQVLLTLATILTALYLRCFRLSEFDPGAAAMAEAEKEKLEQLSDSASNLTKTGFGEEL